MAEEKENQNKKENLKDDCPFCRVSEETLEILKEKGKEKKKDNDKKEN
jgi:hypothetical protein